MNRFFSLFLGFALCGISAPSQAQPTISGYSISVQNELYWPILKFGKRSEKVRILQRLLNINVASLKVDGNFGLATEKAVRNFQTARKITADGVVGAQTWEKLIVPLERGSHGPIVGVFQALLVQNGYRVKQDGIFGKETEKAVRTFQKKIEGKSLRVDGRARLWVWCWLLGGSSTFDR